MTSVLFKSASIVGIVSRETGVALVEIEAQ